jgi:hypothetical protein
LENIRRRLVALFPSQHDTDLISKTTNAWVLLKVLCTPIEDLFHNNDPKSTFNLRDIAKRHPVTIARTVLYIVLSIQQLPPDFDMSRLSLGPNIDLVLYKYTNTIADIVQCNEELFGSIEGIECLLYLNMFHVNAGNLRRAWLCSRKAISIAQMKGFHKDPKRAPGLFDSKTALSVKVLWTNIVLMDRYLAVILGVVSLPLPVLE